MTAWSTTMEPEPLPSGLCTMPPQAPGCGLPEPVAPPTELSFTEVNTTGDTPVPGADNEPPPATRIDGWELSTFTTVPAAMVNPPPLRTRTWLFPVPTTNTQSARLVHVVDPDTSIAQIRTPLTPLPDAKSPAKAPASSTTPHIASTAGPRLCTNEVLVTTAPVGATDTAVLA